MLVSMGLVEVCAVIDTTTSMRGYGPHLRRLGTNTVEGLRDVGGGHGEWDIHGIDSPGIATALVAQKYMDLYGATTDDLAAVCVGIRANAAMNPMAIMSNRPMDKAAYYAEPIMAGPFRRPDFCLMSEGSVCLLVTSSDRAQNGAKAAVRIAGVVGLQTSRDDYVLFARPGLGAGIESRAPLRNLPVSRVYARAGVGLEDIDGVYIYDSFSSNVWMVLERFGFCGEGEAATWVNEHGIGPTDSLPVNTNGGLLSEAHLSGHAHLVEMVRQLRGECGTRQIPNAGALQWATPRGDSVILTR